MKSGAYWTISHGAARVLALLVLGETEQRNGRLELTDAQANEVGLRSHELLSRSMPELIRVGLVVQTRRIKRKARHAAHYAVTWWKIHFVDGVKLERPEPASHAYLRFARERRKFKVKKEKCSPRSSGDITPIVGVNGHNHRPDSASESVLHHPDDRGTLQIFGGTAGFSVTLCRLSARLRVPNSIRKAEAQSGEARSSGFSKVAPS